MVGWVGQSLAFSSVSSFPRDPLTCPQNPPRKKTELTNQLTGTQDSTNHVTGIRVLSSVGGVKDGSLIHSFYNHLLIVYHLPKDERHTPCFKEDAG